MAKPSNTLTISASPGTDIWRIPPSKDDFNAPSSLHAPIPLSSFYRTRVSFSAPWKHLYDQGGILLHLTKADEKARWVKTGIEFYNNRTFISTVGCDNWADWSIYPAEGEEITIEVKKEVEGDGHVLWVHQLVLNPSTGEVEERLPVREITWFFANDGGWEVQVGAYAARPATKETVEGGESELQVKFWGWEFEER